MPDINYWLGVKYGILGKQAQGEYQKNVAEANEVAPNAASRRALEAAQGSLLGEQGTGEHLLNQPLGYGAAPGVAARVLGLTPEFQQAYGPQRPQQQAPGPAPSTSPPIGSAYLQGAQQPAYLQGRIKPNPFMAGASGTLGADANPSLLSLTGSSGTLGAPPSLLSPTPYRKGTSNVRTPPGKGKGKGGKGSPQGLEAILPSLLAASQNAQMGGSSVGPQAVGAPPPPPMASGAAAPPGFARGAGTVRPNYPFGAGYLFGAAQVPGQGSGATDKVPAMLAPHEAVLNRAAADMLGRSRIAALNAKGAKQMGLRRGTP